MEHRSVRMTPAEKLRLEEMFDLPSESACSFDSEVLAAAPSPVAKEAPPSPAALDRPATGCHWAASTAASDFSGRMSSTMDTDEKSRWEQLPVEDFKTASAAALNFGTALMGASSPRHFQLWNPPVLEKPEAPEAFGLKANRLVQQQAAFVQKVEQELKRFGQTLDHHSCFQQALQRQVEDHGRVWRREAEDLSKDLQQLRAQLAQTMEAALWSGKEVACVRKEIASLDQREERPKRLVVSELDAVLQERLAKVEERLETCNRHVTESNDFFAKAVAEVSQTVAQLSETVSTVKLQGLRPGSEPHRLPQPPPVVSKWLADGVDIERSPTKLPHSPEEELLLSAPADQCAPKVSKSSTSNRQQGPHELVTDGKRGARLGGRRIPVR